MPMTGRNIEHVHAIILKNRRHITDEMTNLLQISEGFVYLNIHDWDDNMQLCVKLKTFFP